MPAALLTGRKQLPFCDTIKIKLSVNSPKVTACNLITPEMKAVNPTVYHLIQKQPESIHGLCVWHPVGTCLCAASHRSSGQEIAGMLFLLTSGRCLPHSNCCPPCRHSNASHVYVILRPILATTLLMA
jgi:hypothetical protein